MPIYYLDSSAIAKRYVREIGSPRIDDLLSRETISISTLSKVELASAFARRIREGTLSPIERDSIYRRFIRETRNFAVMTLSASIVREAALLLHSTPPTIPLRSLDALHIASALSLFARARRHGLAEAAFVASDRTLIAAARWAGLTVVNPEDEP